MGTRHETFTDMYVQYVTTVKAGPSHNRGIDLWTVFSIVV